MKKSTAIFLMIIFTSLISAPTVILSIDKSIDTSFFYNINEEEEKEGVKMVFEIVTEYTEDIFSGQDDTARVIYAHKTYQKPHLHLVSPPPEKVFV